MKQSTRWTILLVLLLTAVVLVFVASPSPPPPVRSLDISLSPISQSGADPAVWEVTISNRSSFPVLYAGGFGRVCLKTAFLTEEGWKHDVRLMPGGGSGVISPGETVKDSVKIPRGVTRAKIGLGITSLSWRGKLAWRISRTRFQWPLRSVVHYLLEKDLRGRRSTEWSEEFVQEQAGQ